jgi:hypothetical protein
MTPREYAISLGLAKPGRGRLSREAHAAIEKAKTEGMTFDGDVKPLKSSKPKSSKIPKHRPGGATIDEESGLVIYDINAEPDDAPRNYKPRPNHPIVRDSVMKGFTPEGYAISFGVCYRCSEPVSRCACREGVLPPPSVARLA